MRLHELNFENFHGIECLNLDLSGENIILFGENGAGKTSILHGVSLIFSNIITKVSAGQVRGQMRGEPADVRVGASVLSLSGQFVCGKEVLGFGLSYDKRTKKTGLPKDSASFVTQYASLYAGEDVGLPIFAHYEIDRTIQDIPLKAKNEEDIGRMAAYRNALGIKDFKPFFQWFRNQEDIENQDKVELENLEYKDPTLEAVRTAIYAINPDLSGLTVKRSPLQMCVTKNGLTLTIKQLSDGEKNTLALFGDIARWLAIANPQLDDPLQGDGIVLIDEVALHLHPSWQRKILCILRKTFPNVQFILTTHYPQVLRGLQKEFRVVSLEGREGEFVVREVDPWI